MKQHYTDARGSLQENTRCRPCSTPTSCYFAGMQHIRTSEKNNLQYACINMDRDTLTSVYWWAALNWKLMHAEMVFREQLAINCIAGLGVFVDDECVCVWYVCVCMQ